MAGTFSYRNGRYQGCCNEELQRHGFGMFISDESEVLLGSARLTQHSGGAASSREFSVTSETNSMPMAR